MVLTNLARSSFLIVTCESLTRGCHGNVTLGISGHKLRYERFLVTKILLLYIQTDITMTMMNYICTILIMYSLIFCFQLSCNCGLLFQVCQSFSGGGENYKKKF